MSNSPFKFLSAYEKKDKDFFFGREKETDELYEMTYDTNLMLVVGASGTGKSSLVRCGLSNKIKETRWYDIYIKRDKDINVTLENELDKELKRSGGIKFGETPSILDKLENIYRATFTPIYLIFDQFEEIFIINPDVTEQKKFFNAIQSIITASTPCKVIIIMREEFTPHLWKHEKTVPTIFDYKYRVEGMRPENMKMVVSRTLDEMHSQKKLVVEDSKEIGEKVVDSLMRSAAGLELTYLQVYLDRLYRKAEENKGDPPVITPSLFDELEGFDDILKDFLDEQLKELGKRLNLKENEPIRILGEMVTEGKTKKALERSEQHEVAKKLKLSVEKLDECIQAYVNMRVIRQYDDGRIELAHDVLGPKIWELLPENDRQLRGIKKSFDQRYKDYTKGGSLLGVEDVDSWKEYLPLLELNNDQEQFIEDSKKEIGKKARTRRNVMVVLGSLLLVSIIFLALAVYSYIDKRNAINKVKDLTIDGLYNKALIYSEEREYKAAIENLIAIKSLYGKIDSIETKIRHFSEDKEIYEKYLSYQEKGDSLIQKKQYKDAMDQFEEVFKSEYITIMRDELTTTLDGVNQSLKIDRDSLDSKYHDLDLLGRNRERDNTKRILDDVNEALEQITQWIIELKNK